MLGARPFSWRRTTCWLPDRLGKRVIALEHGRIKGGYDRDQSSSLLLAPGVSVCLALSPAL